MSVPPTDMLLEKGLEEEVFTATPDGTAVGLSSMVCRGVAGFQCEPDLRIIEFVTAPHRSYTALGDDLVKKRTTLVRFLHSQGDYHLLPGANMPLGGYDRFLRSKPENPYHTFIEEAYGSRIVTASTHVNIGLHQPEKVLQAYRVLRAEAWLFLAITASSPFMNGALSGYHSSRWHQFPHNPETTPFFRDHAHYVFWMHKSLQDGQLFTPAHLWVSARPNGPHPPEQLNRLELRICDRIQDLDLALAIVALLEARVWEILTSDEIDPLLLSPFDDQQLLTVTAENERRVSEKSLDATITCWIRGEEIPVREYITAYLASSKRIATLYGFASYLKPIETVLQLENQAQRWIQQFEYGQSVAEIFPQEMAIESVGWKSDEQAEAERLQFSSLR